MSEAVKEELAYLRLWIGILAVTLISLGSWLFLSYEAASALLLVGALAGLMLLSIGCFQLHRRIERKIGEIRRL
ncbi:MAG TPA: hypothetical protein VF254_05615 [Gammaproteobacteria bacterium]